MKIWPLFVYSLLWVLLLAACTFPAGQPTSPPASIADSPLIGNRWRLEQILVDGKPVSFSAAAPVYIEFTPTGYLHTSYAGRCFADYNNLVRFSGAFYNEPTYQLLPGMGVMDGCSTASPESTEACISELGPDHVWEACRDLIDAEYRAPTHIDATNSYELANDHLTLRGERIEMTYVMDNP